MARTPDHRAPGLTAEESADYYAAHKAYADWRADRIDTSTYDQRLAALGYRRGDTITTTNRPVKV
jgi:hypothetical protein